MRTLNSRILLLAGMMALGGIVTGCPPEGGGTTPTTTTPTTTTTTSTTTSTSTTTTSTTTTTTPPPSFSWLSNPRDLEQDVIGSVFSAICPPNGFALPVYGVSTYTSDSSICTAAVFEGRIGFAAGGGVTYRIEAGLEAYPGATANGVTTSVWPFPWPMSFVFVDS